jgi:hypothetical protein
VLPSSFTPQGALAAANALTAVWLLAAPSRKATIFTNGVGVWWPFALVGEMALIIALAGNFIPAAK